MAGRGRLLSLVAVAAAALSTVPAPAADVVASSGNIAVATRDSLTVSSTINVTQTAAVSDLNVRIRVTHTKDSDLKAVLWAPDGTKVELFSDVGGNGDDFGTGTKDCGVTGGAFTTLDSQATQTLYAPYPTGGGPPFAGSFQPDGPAALNGTGLNAVRGKSMNGTWRLEITDDPPKTVDGAVHEGTLHCWQLVFGEGDGDGDGLNDNADNCPLVPNPSQADTDGDGLGDACDGDTDGDTVPDASDNCRTIANTNQKNTDGDAMGDVCDPDDDNDGKTDGEDNCPLVANAGQADLDDDGAGDACDNDTDNDGLTNAEETTHGTNPTKADTDLDGLNDGAEVHQYGSDPKDADTDGDLHADGTEVDGGADPANPLSIPGPAGPITLNQETLSELPVTDDLAPLQ